MALKVGDRVKVMNTTYGGKTVVEGIATIVEVLPGNMGRCMVNFDGDPKKETYARFCDEENKVNA